MWISFLVGFAIGAVIGAVIDICIDVYNEWLSSQRAKELAARETGKIISKLCVDNLKKNAEYGETIDVRAFDENNDLIANITYNASKGSALYKGQTIY